MYLSKNLKYLRLNRGFSQDYISDMLGYKSYTTIQKWEMGTSEPSISILKKLSKLYNVDMDTMYTVDLENDDGNSKLKDINKIPLLGTIAAGVPLLAQENIEDYFNIDNRLKCDFALRIQGDSMINAGIFNNDIVFIKKQSDLNNGDIGAVLLDDSATLKRFFRDNGTIILQAENDNYKPKVYTDGNLLILGKLVAVLNIRD